MFTKQFEYVNAVVNCGSISKAAENLNIAQSTLSKYLKKTENNIGMEIFDRSTIPIRLTKAGECYLKFGIQILDLQHQMEKQLQEIQNNQNTVIRIGISPSRSQYIMPKIIENYRKGKNLGQIIIEERKTSELTKGLENGELDLIISILDEDTKNFEQICLFEEEILLAVSNEICNDTDSLIDILSSVPLISVGKGQTMWQTMNRLVDVFKVNQPLIECQSIESAFSLVKRRLGATLVPSYIVEYETEEQQTCLLYKKIPDNCIIDGSLDNKRTVCLFYRKQQFLTQTEKTFISCVKEVIK